MNIGPYQLEAPLVNAGGLVKSPEDVDRMARTPVGAVLGGSFTLDERVGNSPGGEVVYYHDPVTATTYNSLGMPNKGVRALAASGELQRMIDIAHDLGKPFILNIAPVTDDPVGEVIAMSEQLARAKIDNLDALELNASCPNVVLDNGGRHEILSHHPQLLGRVLSELSHISASEVPLGTMLVRVSPFRDAADAVNLAEVSNENGVAIVSAFNTFPGGRPTKKSGGAVLKVPGGVGGQSGLGMASRAEEQTGWLIDARTVTNSTFEIMGSNGIGDALTMKRRLELGCAAVSATTLFWQSASWGNAASRLLSDYADLLDV
jgi:dihydroorotate dehydrogenase